MFTAIMVIAAFCLGHYIARKEAHIECVNGCCQNDDCINADPQDEEQIIG